MLLIPLSPRRITALRHPFWHTFASPTSFRLSPTIPKGLQTPFQHGHDVEYGLEVTERDSAGTVLSFSCRFCLMFGCEAEPGAKRKRTSNEPVFRRPFHSDGYKKHNSSAHPEISSRFLDCSLEEKAMFFDGYVNYDSRLLAHLESGEALTLIHP